jgi:ribosomal protein L14E/L6E/L27E
MEDDDLLIDTPWGKKKWKLVRRGLRYVERFDAVMEEKRAKRSEASKRAWETRRNKLKGESK